jgi:hypothetical protein
MYARNKALIRLWNPDPVDRYQTASIDGISLKSMSSSLMARRRTQSVRDSEALEVSALLMESRLAGGDQSDQVIVFSMVDYRSQMPQKVRDGKAWPMILGGS